MIVSVRAGVGTVELEAIKTEMSNTFWVCIVICIHGSRYVSGHGSLVARHCGGSDEHSPASPAVAYSTSNVALLLESSSAHAVILY